MCDSEITTQLVRGCSDHRRVRLEYRSEAGSQWFTDVDAWAVVVRHGRWYLLCRSVRNDAVRTYRVDRVLQAELLDDGFDPPVDLDPVGMLEHHLGSGWEYHTEVTIDAPVDQSAVSRRAH